MNSTNQNIESSSPETPAGDGDGASYVSKDGSIHLNTPSAGLGTRTSSSPSPVERILDLLDGVQETGSRQWEARCPAHDDDTSSLSVSTGKGGRAHLDCSHGCEWDDILDELGLEHQDLFPDDVDASWAPEDGTEARRYTYQDADGNPVYDVVRYEMRNPGHPAYGETKYVEQAYLPDHDEAGQGECPDGYVWGRERHGVDPVLYRLPDVLDEDVAIWLVETEEEVHALTQNGLVATTHPEGTGEWHSSYTETLSESEGGVVILPHNNPGGMVHAHAIAEEIHSTTVKIVDLPGRRPGEGITEWLAGKKTDRDLVAQANKVPRFNPMGLSDTQEGPPPDPSVFWYVDNGSVKINRPALTSFLHDRGYGKVYAESPLDSTLVKVDGRVIRRTSTERIKDHMLDYLRNEVPDGDGLPLRDGSHDEDRSTRNVVEALMKGANVYFSSSLYEFLPRLDLDPHRPDANIAYFYFENGFVEVTPGGYELCPYTELDGVIWEDQIIDRPFTNLSGYDLSDSDWARHLWNVAGHEEQRHAALRSALGYLQHGYKDPATTKAIIFMDETDTGSEDGRTGKSLTAKALQKTRSVVRMDGRNFSFGRFGFQEVRLDTNIVDFNDAKEHFKFDRLFSLITDDFQVERKNKDQITIPFEDSPKFLLSTNYVIDGQGDSFEDRTFQVEFADYYGPDYTPKDEFGCRFFDEWDREAWARFDNLMIECVRHYLKNGLVDYERANVNRKRLKKRTSSRFAEWILDFIELGTKYRKEDVRESFRESRPPNCEDVDNGRFGKWMKTFADIYGLEEEMTRPRVEGDRVRYVTFEREG